MHSGGAAKSVVRDRLLLWKQVPFAALLRQFCIEFRPYQQDDKKGRTFRLLHLLAHSRFAAVARDVRHPDRDYLKRQDIIFHLAAISGQAASETDPNETRSINVDATTQLVRALDSHQYLVFPSTTSFYGFKGTTCDEASEPSPLSLCGKTKWEAERIVIDRERSVVLRPTTAFGLSSRMRSELLVNDFVESAVRNKRIVLCGADGGRSFVHIDDLIRGYLFVLESIDSMTGEVFNIGNSALNLTKSQIARAVQSICPCEVVDSGVPATDTRDFVVAFTKIEALGFRCLYDLEHGIRQLAKWYRLGAV